MSRSINDLSLKESTSFKEDYYNDTISSVNKLLKNYNVDVEPRDVYKFLPMDKTIYNCCRCNSFFYIKNESQRALKAKKSDSLELICIECGFSMEINRDLYLNPNIDQFNLEQEQMKNRKETLNKLNFEDIKKLQTMFNLGHRIKKLKKDFNLDIKRNDLFNLLPWEKTEQKCKRCASNLYKNNISHTNIHNSDNRDLVCTCGFNSGATKKKNKTHVSVVTKANQQSVSVIEINNKTLISNKDVEKEVVFTNKVFLYDYTDNSKVKDDKLSIQTMVDLGIFIHYLEQGEGILSYTSDSRNKIVDNLQKNKIINKEIILTSKYQEYRNEKKYKELIYCIKSAIEKEKNLSEIIKYAINEEIKGYVDTISKKYQINIKNLGLLDHVVDSLIDKYTLEEIYSLLDSAFSIALNEEVNKEKIILEKINDYIKINELNVPKYNIYLHRRISHLTNFIFKDICGIEENIFNKKIIELNI